MNTPIKVTGFQAFTAIFWLLGGIGISVVVANALSPPQSIANAGLIIAFLLSFVVLIVWRNTRKYGKRILGERDKAVADAKEANELASLAFAQVKAKAEALDQARESLEIADSKNSKLGAELTRARQDNARAREGLASASKELNRCAEELGTCRGELTDALASASAENSRADALQARVEDL